MEEMKFLLESQDQPVSSAFYGNFGLPGLSYESQNEKTLAENSLNR